MRLNFYFFLLLFFSLVCSAQNTKNINPPDAITRAIDDQIKEYKLLASSNPEEAIKKLKATKEHSEKIYYKEGAMRSSMGLVLLYYNDGNYKKTIEESQFTNKYAQELEHYEYLSDIHRMKANAYGEMALLNESLKELEKALPYNDKIESKNIRSYKMALIYESYAGIYEKKEDPEKQLFYRKKSISESKKMPEKNALYINAKFQNLAFQYASLGLIYSDLKVKDSANYYFNKALDIHENNKYNIYINGRAVLLSDMAKFYTSNKNYEKAVLFAKRAETFEKQAPMPYIRRDIYQSLFNSYIETAKKDSSKYYLKLYSTLNDSIIKSEKESVMAPVNQIISDKEIESNQSIRNLKVSSAAIIVVLILSGWIYWRRRNKILRKNYEQMIDKLKNTQSDRLLDTNDYNEEVDTISEPEINDEQSHSLGKNIISIRTEARILKRLQAFEKSEKFLRKELTVSLLATQLNTNSKYLSEIIKNNKSQSFSTYVNSLRINYIVHKIYNDPKYREYKISYLAEACGYASPQVFVLAFKKTTGVTPSYFIQNLNDEKINLVH